MEGLFPMLHFRSSISVVWGDGLITTRAASPPIARFRLKGVVHVKPGPSFRAGPMSDKLDMLTRQRRKIQWSALNWTKRQFALAHGTKTYLVRLQDEEIG